VKGRGRGGAIGGAPPIDTVRLATLASTFVESERAARVAVLDAVDAGASVRHVARATGLPLAVIVHWTGDIPDLEGERVVVDDIAARRQRRNRTVAERIRDAQDHRPRPGG
jgi:hypothetical protein